MFVKTIPAKSVIFYSFVSEDQNIFLRPCTSRGSESIFWDGSQAPVCCGSSQVVLMNQNRDAWARSQNNWFEISGVQDLGDLYCEKAPLSWFRCIPKNKKCSLQLTGINLPTPPGGYTMLNENSIADRLQPFPQLTSRWLSNLDKC